MRKFAAPRRLLFPGPAYPVIQWHHGVPGGFEIPCRYFPPSLELGGRVQLQHSGGNEECWLLPRMHLSIAGWRNIVWTRSNGQGREVAQGIERPWEQGYRSRWQILIVTQELWEHGYQGFCVLSVGGVICRALRKALWKFQELLHQIARKEDVSLPTYALWLECEAGQPERTPQGALVTPLRVIIPEVEDVLKEQHFIPEEVQYFLEQRLDEVERWERNARPSAEDWLEEEEAQQEEQPVPQKPAEVPARKQSLQEAQETTRWAADASADASASVLEELALPFSIRGENRVYPRGADVRQLAGDRRALEVARRVKRGRVASVAADLLVALER